MTALEFFQMENIHQLPVEPEKLIKRRKIPLYTYEEFSELTGDSLSQIIQEYDLDGFSTYAGGYPIIIYNNSRLPERIRWTQMHELSHIVLGHLGQCGGTVKRGSKKDYFDRHADYFTVNVLAPLPLLKLCDVKDVVTIRCMTGMSNTASSIRLKELGESYFRKKDLDAYRAQFSEYIEQSSDDLFLADLYFDFEMNYILRRDERIYQARKAKMQAERSKKGRLTKCHPLGNGSGYIRTDEKLDKMIDAYYSVD